MIRTVIRALGALFAGSLLAVSAQAADLTIGLSTPITSLDPHFHQLTPNISLARHVFETLIETDENQRLKPGLAESWKSLGDLEWELKLRKGVKWHNGQEFTADDVIATIKRVPNVPNSPASYAFFVRPIVDIQALDKYTLRLKTVKPHPLLPNDLSTIMMIPKSVAETAKTEDFNSGKAMIGTGPFRYAEYVPGDRVVMKRNDTYWGAKPAWETVRFKMIPSAPARVAALLAGDVQVIEAVPTTDIANLKKDKRVALSSAVSNRIIYLHMDSNREKNSPFVTTTDGKPMEANPLRDPRVRKAISKMIDRDAIIARIMEGQGVAAGQLLPETFFGTSKTLKPEKYDPEGARKLLAEAGYPNGFGITLHAPNNRYINDAAVAQAVAQFMSRNGIATKLETMPSNVFFSRGSKLEFSILLAGWGAETGETSSPLRSLLATFDKEQGLGAANRGRFSDAGVDALLSQALTTIDDTKRGILLARAAEKAVGELTGIVPLHYEVSTWATRAGITYKARSDQYTFAYEVRPTK